MAGRGRGMASNMGQPGVPGGSAAAPVGHGGPGGDERRELRRPIVGQTGPSPDDLVHGLAKMEPYREDYNRFGGFSGQGPAGGQQSIGPPRPAPNADGWSSGENQFDQRYQQQWNDPAANNFAPHNINGAQHQFQQQHNQFPSQQQMLQQQHAQQQAQANWNFNIGASEFVPKSSLSVTAQEFVPRQMPRNTSYWAQQQQQQQEQQLLFQQQSELEQQISAGYDQPQAHNYDMSAAMRQPAADYNHQPAAPHQRTQQPHHQGGGYGGGRGGGYGGGRSSGSEGGGQSSNSSSAGMGGGYDPREMLSDAVATLVFMPTKFERTSFQLAEKFNVSVVELNTLTSLVVNLVDNCLKEKNFRSMAGRFCDYMANNVRLEFEGNTFRSILLERYQAVHANHTTLISSNPEQFRSLVIFSTDLYLRFLQQKSSNESEEGEISTDVEKRQPILANLLYQLFTSVVTVGKEDSRNLTTVVDMLKLSGKLLEEDEKGFIGNNGKATQMDSIFDELSKLSQDNSDGSGCPANIKKLLNRLVEIRASGWKIEESERPTIFDVPEPKGPAASASSTSGKRSNAIKIVKPPEEPVRNSAKSRGSQQKSGECKENIGNKGSALPPEEQALTEAELRFMCEQMGDTDSDAECLAGMDNGGESDIGSVEGMMPEDVEAAYQEFLNEQQKSKAETS